MADAGKKQKRQQCLDALEVDAAGAGDKSVLDEQLRKMRFKWHPDRHRQGAKKQAEEHFKFLQEAYEFLLRGEGEENGGGESKRPGTKGQQKTAEEAGAGVYTNQTRSASHLFAGLLSRVQ